jgi:hypothetical protein
MNPPGPRSHLHSRLARRLLDGLMGVSLLLCVTASVLWVRSHFIGEQWAFPPGRVTGRTTAPWGEVDTWRLQYVIRSGSGRLQIVRMERQAGGVEPAGRTTLPPAGAVAGYGPGMTRSDRWLDLLGFGYLRRDKQYYVGPQSRGSFWGFRVLTVSYWCMVVVAGALPASWLTAYARRRRCWRRAVKRLCPGCGYDLRASPGRCPECGILATPLPPVNS